MEKVRSPKFWLSTTRKNKLHRHQVLLFLLHKGKRMSHKYSFYSGAALRSRIPEVNLALKNEICIAREAGKQGSRSSLLVGASIYEYRSSLLWNLEEYTGTTLTQPHTTAMYDELQHSVTCSKIRIQSVRQQQGISCEAHFTGNL